MGVIALLESIIMNRYMIDDVGLHHIWSTDKQSIRTNKSWLVIIWCNSGINFLWFTVLIRLKIQQINTINNILNIVEIAMILIIKFIRNLMSQIVMTRMIYGASVEGLTVNNNLQFAVLNYLRHKQRIANFINQ